MKFAHRIGVILAAALMVISFAGAPAIAQADNADATERFLADRHHSFVERLGVTVPALLVVEQSQAVQRDRDIGVVGTARFLPERQRAARQWYGF
jgi:hypothetical protein